jgi:hypothetical protein
MWQFTCTCTNYPLNLTGYQSFLCSILKTYTYTRHMYTYGYTGIHTENRTHSQIVEIVKRAQSKSNFR